MVGIPDADFTMQVTVDRPPEQVFEAILRVRDWWMTDVTGDNERIGDVFSFEVPSVHSCSMRVVQLDHGRRIVWRVIKSAMPIFRDPGEWVGSDLTFALTSDDRATRVHFTHVGLSPADECYEVCSAAWAHYIGFSLRGLVSTGSGVPGFNPAAVTR
jgi:uncharacterized protein YndB with AHSA1/START domain